MGSKDEPETLYAMAAPPNAPPLVRVMGGKIETVLATFEPGDASDEAAKQLHHIKALALITLAALHLSRAPDDKSRLAVIDKIPHLLERLVEDNEKLSGKRLDS